MIFSDYYPIFIDYGIRLLGAILVLAAGLKITGLLSRAAEKRFRGSGIDPGLTPFLTSLLKALLKVLVVISAISMLGVEMTSFIAVIGALAFAVGLALQGSLANFAGGVLILLLKPFQAGDYIEAAGHGGTVREIQIFYTLLDTPDNKRIVIPNALLSNSSAINYSANPTRRVDFAFGAAYEADSRKVKEILTRLAEKDPRITADPSPQVVMAEHGDSAVIYYLRAWCRKEDYWPVYFEMTEEVKTAFGNAGIGIPYPQREIHLAGNLQKTHDHLSQP